jgi:imidazolonepropionase-like amidohydrolase
MKYFYKYYDVHGITQLEVIKIATRNGAQALGIEEDVGIIEPGK